MPPITQDDHVARSVDFRLGVWANARRCIWHPPQTPERRVRISQQPIEQTPGTTYLSELPRVDAMLRRYIEIGVAHRTRIGINPQDNAAYTNRVTYPVITHNRPCDANFSVLSPLLKPHLQTIRKPLIDPYCWNDKRPELIWRGAMRNSSRVSNDWLLNQESAAGHAYQTFSGVGFSISNRIAELFHSGIRGLDHIDTLMREFAIENFVRYRFLARWHRQYNLAITDWDFVGIDLHSIGDLSEYLSPPCLESLRCQSFIRDLPIAKHLPMSQQLSCKYLLNLEGNDVSTGLPYFLQSNSVVLSPRPRWDNIFTYELQPWVHYVPLRQDASDLAEMLDYCRRNDSRCREIAINATRYMQRFTMKSENEIESEVHRRLAALSETAHLQ